MTADARYQSFMGLGPKKIAHWEHWSNPDAETYLTGIDYYEHPRLCRLKLKELYPQLGLGVPETDDPMPRPEEQEDQGKGRWGDRTATTGSRRRPAHRFKSREEMLRFSPLEQGDFTGWNVVVDGDFSSEEVIYERYRKTLPGRVGRQGPGRALPRRSGSTTRCSCGRCWSSATRTFLASAWSRSSSGSWTSSPRSTGACSAPLPGCRSTSSSATTTSCSPRGPVCSPAWMHKYIFPRYEEFWGILKEAGKEVIFMVDGCVDAFVDDVMACGARGIISEPFTDYKAIARRYENCFIAGEGDNRVLMRNDPAEIRAMVEIDGRDGPDVRRLHDVHRQPHPLQRARRGDQALPRPVGGAGIQIELRRSKRRDHRTFYACRA